MQLGFVFPGQGSQSPGMGSFLVQNFKEASEVFELASDTIKLDLKKLCFTGSEQELALTENTQPALLTVSTATAVVLKKHFGVKSTITAGHSIGEYASLVEACSIRFSDAISAVRLRGQAMQSAVPVGLGGMTATLGLNQEQAEFLCRWVMEQSGFQPLSPANYNCDGQIVISGSQKALDWLKVNFKPEVLPGETKRAKLIPLQVSAPFHCSMMKPAEEKMSVFLKGISFQDAKIPVIQNVNAQAETAATNLCENLIKQVSAPVLWTQTMQTFKNKQVASLVECGNGSVLKGLFKKSDPEFFKVYSTNSLDDLKTLETALK